MNRYMYDTISIGNHTHLSAIQDYCTSNSQVIAQGEAECNFDCYVYCISILAKIPYSIWDSKRIVRDLCWCRATIL